MGETRVARPLTVGGALAAARDRLHDAGVDSPGLDAELLLAEALGVERARLVLDRDLAVDGGALERYDALVRRREAREPVAYILGRRGFRHLTLSVDRRVLIPRPETELLVETALEVASGARVLDVGTGSGAIALALADERPDLEVWASDRSPDALDVARENARRLGLDVHFAAGDLLDLDGPAPDRWDAVLSNPPYVSTGAALAPEITRYEPPAALFAGVDGLVLVRRLIAAATGRAELLAIEIGAEQGAAVAELMRAAGRTGVEIRHDLAGLDRVVVGREAA